MDPEERICDRCKKPFLAVTPNQTTCSPCMIAPSPLRRLIAGRRKATTMPAEKNCEKCGKPFIPACNRQKFCPEHSPKIQARVNGAKRPRKTAVRFDDIISAMDHTPALVKSTFTRGKYLITIERTA